MLASELTFHFGLDISPSLSPDKTLLLEFKGSEKRSVFITFPVAVASCVQHDQGNLEERGVDFDVTVLQGEE